jgi:hypothetical protein
MTQFVVVNPGPDTTVPTGPQYGVKYTLTNNDGLRCVFNDEHDADYVGWLTGISGFDSPDVREAADDLVGDDGGVHGLFYYGRRPVVLDGMIDSRPDNVERNLRMTRLQRSSNAMRTDSTLRWMPEGGVEQEIHVRRQQPLRISGGYNKSFQLSLVSSDPRIYSAEVREVILAPNDVDEFLVNAGTIGSPPDISINGPATAIEVHNGSTGQSVVFAPAYSILVNQRLDISFANRTVMRENGTNVYGQVQFASTSWWDVRPGSNNIAWEATGTTGASSMIVRWRDAWV